MFRPAVLGFLFFLQHSGNVRACHTAGARLRTFLDPCRGLIHTRHGQSAGGGSFPFPRPSALYKG